MSHEKYIKWVYLSGLKYFSGNIKDPVIPCQIRYNSIYYFPGVFYVEPWHRSGVFTVNDVVNNSESDMLITVLVHPFNWYFNDDVKNILSRIIDRVSKIYTILLKML